MNLFSSFSKGLLCSLAAAGTTFAGQYTNDFNAYFVGQFFGFGDGSTLVSSPPEALAAHVEDPVLKELQLSQWNITDFRAAFLLPDLDPGSRIYSFSASWVAPVYGDSPNAGEGFSFSFGPVQPLNLVTGSVESGYGVGLCFSVKTGTNNPGFYLLRNGTVIASQTNNPTAVWGNFSSTRHAFQVDWDNDTGLTVRRNGVAIFSNIKTDGFVPAAGDSFVWAARGGAASQTYRIDNVSVSTVTQAAPTIRAVWAGSQFSPVMTVSADVNTRGLETTVTFEFGTTTAYGSSQVQVLSAGSGLNVGVNKQFTFDTDRQIPLHARVTASNALGTVVSSDVRFCPSPFEKRGSFPQAGGSGGVWADMNDDGLLDLLVHGRYDFGAQQIRFFINRGTTPWTPVGAIGGFLQSFASVGDFDNDNRPDVFCTGGASSGATTPIVGERVGIFYGVASNQLSALASSQATYLQFPFYLSLGHSLAADFDHDGRQDILFTGGMSPDYTGFTNAPDPLVVSGRISRMLRNEFSGARGHFQNSYFRLMPTPLRGMGHFNLSDSGFISSGDLDADGFPDVYSYGFPDPSALQDLGWEVLRNDGEMGLAVTQKGNRGLGGTLYGGSCNVWADFNGDGLDDLVVAEGGSVPAGYPLGQVRVLLNDGQGHLTDSGPPLVGMGWTDLAVGDIFNHGRNDIIVFGYDHNLAMPPNAIEPVASILIFRNEGNGVFTRLDYGFVPLGVPSIAGQGIQLADYDRDGRLDFCEVAGRIATADDIYGDNATTALYRNELDIPSNAPPQAPAGLSTVVGPGTVTFQWGSATDDITPTNLLTYNLRVGTNPLGASVVSPLADVTTGWRKVAAPGNCRHTFSALYRLPPGTYYWSVQAVDGAFAGGAWAPEQTFTITSAESPRLTISRYATGNNLKWPARFTGYAVEESSGLTAGSAWTSNSVPIGTDNGKWNVPVTNAAAATFYRLRK